MSFQPLGESIEFSSIHNEAPNEAKQQPNVLPVHAYARSLRSCDVQSHLRNKTSLSKLMVLVGKIWNFFDKLQRAHTGYRAGVLASAGFAAVSLLINVIVLIWIDRHIKFTDGIGPLSKGSSCKETSRLNFWIHLGINVLSSVLLSGSNYCMQCLSAPTRQDVDRAHAQFKDLDIGVPSLRNLREISWTRVSLWWILCFSSLPLHLMYNSAVFSTISVHDFEILTVTEGFVRGDPYNSFFENSGSWLTEEERIQDGSNSSPLLKEIQNNSTQYQRRNIQDCISDYAQEFVTKNGTVLLVVSSDSNKSYWSDKYWWDSSEFPLNLQLINDELNFRYQWGKNETLSESWPSNGSLLNYSISLLDSYIVLDNSTYNTAALQEYYSSIRDYVRAQQEIAIGQCRAQLSGSVKARYHYSFREHVADTDPYAWICEGDEQFQAETTCANGVSKILPHLKTWTTLDYCDSYVMYCLGEKVHEECTLRFSLWITLVVILCNMGKLGAMLLVLQTSSHIKPLITLGDAIESFLIKPDPNTETLCLVTRQNIGSQNTVVIEKNFGERGNLGLLARDWQCSTRRWYHSATFGRWRISFLFSLLALGAVTGLLVGALLTFTGRIDLRSLWNMGFGSVTGRTLLPTRSTNALYYNIFRANLPQTIFSLLYFAINSLITSMLLGREWNAFASTRKTLRVSTPEGDQRSTYTLQLPYKYSIPLMAICGTLQWLLSQSIFLVWIDNVHSKQDNVTPIVTCGYSPISIICVLVVGVLLLVGLVLTGLRKFSNGIPFLPWSSVAISAACHPPPGEENSHLKPLQWGAVLSTKNGDRPLCSFSSGTVTMPVVHPTLEPTYSPLDRFKVPKQSDRLIRIGRKGRKKRLGSWCNRVLHGDLSPIALGVNSGGKAACPGCSEASGLCRYRSARGAVGFSKVDHEAESKKAQKKFGRKVFKETLKAIKQGPPPVKYDNRGIVESDPEESSTLSGSERRGEDESN